jgi:hypothetical protein
MDGACSMHWEITHAEFWLGNLKGLISRHRHRWEDDLREIEYEVMN